VAEVVTAAGELSPVENIETQIRLFYSTCEGGVSAMADDEMVIHGHLIAKLNAKKELASQARVNAELESRAHEAKLQREEEEAWEATRREEAEALNQASEREADRLKECELHLLLTEAELIRLEDCVEEAQEAIETARRHREYGQDAVDRARTSMSECRLDKAAARLGALEAEMKKHVEKASRVMYEAASDLTEVASTGDVVQIARAAAKYLELQVEVEAGASAAADEIKERDVAAQ
jgi:hypothetical protein